MSLNTPQNPENKFRVLIRDMLTVSIQIRTLWKRKLYNKEKTVYDKKIKESLANWMCLLTETSTNIMQKPGTCEILLPRINTKSVYV